MGDFNMKRKIFFFREVAYLVEWWVSMLDAIHTIQNTSEAWSIKYICETLISQLNEWQSLSKWLTKLHLYFNDWDVSIIKSWESTWELIKVLKQLAREYEFITEIQGKFTSAMIYPAVLFFLSISATFYMFIWVLPGIFDIVKDFNADLPALTKYMMAFTKYFQANFGKLMAIIGFWFAWLFLVWSSETWKKKIFSVLLTLPNIWKLIKYYYMVKFFRYMKLMQMSGMNYIDIFVYLKQIMDMPMYQEAIDAILTGIKKWETIYTNMRFYTNIIPADVMVLIKVWEQTANLWQTLDNVVTNYHDELEKGMNNLSKFIEPIVIVFMWWVILMIALSVFGVIGAILDAAQWWA